MNDKIEALRTASEYIVNLEISISKAAEDLYGVEYEKGMAMIAPIAEGLNWISLIIQNTTDVIKGEISLQELNEKLNEIVDAIGNEDNVLIADLFKYELLPIIQKIEKVINNSI